ncbi:MAG: S8 family serine peptidase, partial [Actinomycetota bacterium]|nr:S8 family serine peptidase [Actinomycetota bacterium]
MAAVAFLATVTTAAPVRGAPPESGGGGRGPDGPGRSSSRWRDADRDRIYDDLEADLARRGDDERVPAIVVFTTPVSDEDVARHRRDHGDFRLKARFATVNGYSAELTKGQLNALARRSDVVHIEAEARVKASMSTARASYGVDKAVADFGVSGDGDGNSRSYGPADVATCVIDTGIDAGHVDLDQGQVVGWKDYVNDKASAYDDNGHGTHVAGIVAGQGDANAAFRGVAPGGALVGVKALDSAGSGTSTDIISAVDFCVANRDALNIRIVNMSLGSDGSSDGTDAMSLAASNAFDQGILPVVAAGNAGPAASTIGSPGAGAKALTVCSMADTGERGFFVSSFSSRGTTEDGRTKPDLCAPGHRITAPGANSGTGYVSYSGTSMATPFVAGVAALMLDANAAQTPAELKDGLVATAEDRTATGIDSDTGGGRLRAYDALKRASGLSGNGPDAPDGHLSGTQSLAGTGASDSWNLDVTSAAHPIALTLIVPGASATRDFELNLYDPAGTRVAQSQTPDRQETIGAKPTATGLYRAEVKSVTGSGEYQLD